MECTIYLTDDCNMKCNYCYEGNEKNKSVLSEDKLKTVLQYIIAVSYTHLTLPTNREV